MANKRITMRKIKELLRLHFEANLSQRAIARSLHLSHSTVYEYLTRFKGSPFSWPLDDSVDEESLEKALFPEVGLTKEKEDLPDWREIHRELKRKGMTLSLLWSEYKQEHPDGYQYSQFCELYRRFAKTLRLPMRQIHKAGERLFVDYAGQSVPIVDPATGEVRPAQIFVAVLGASNYTFVEATWSQSLPDWIGSHVRAFEFFGGVPELLVPDNLRSGVTKPCRYDPDINPAYHKMAEHYGTAVLPARVKKPKDKAKAENGVLVAERWILATLRNRTFFSLEELNEAIRALLTRLNQHPFKKLPGCRQTEFERLDQPALKPLPKQHYELADWLKLRARLDYHVEVDRHFYSVPCQLATKEVEIRLTERIVEVFFRGRRVASHQRSHEIGGTTTLREHMPPSHQHYLDWTPEKIMAWASQAGPETTRLFQAIMTDRAHPKVAYPVCLGVIRLEKDYSLERIEAACCRANLIGATRLDSIRSILHHGLDRLPIAVKADPTPIQHDNIRGAAYYARKEVWALPI